MTEVEIVKAETVTVTRDLIEDIYHDLLIGTADRLIALDDLDRDSQEYRKAADRYDRAVTVRQALRDLIDRADFEAGLRELDIIAGA